jgi:hypothetical protein
VNYSKWLKTTFPQLESEPRVKIYNYVTKAREDTRKSRWIIFLINLAILAIIGYVFGKFTNVEPDVFYIALGFIVAVSMFVFNRIVRRIIQTKLTELVT